MAIPQSRYLRAGSAESLALAQLSRELQNLTALLNRHIGSGGDSHAAGSSLQAGFMTPSTVAGIEDLAAQAAQASDTAAQALSQAQAALQAANAALQAAGEVTALDPTLAGLADLTTQADQLIYSTGVDAFAMTALSAYIRSLLGAQDSAAARSILGAASTNLDGGFF